MDHIVNKLSSPTSTPASSNQEITVTDSNSQLDTNPPSIPVTTTTLNQEITDTNSQLHTSHQPSINNLSFAPKQSMVDQFRQ